MLAIKEIRLYGHLGKKFGKSFMFAINSPVEAISALSANIPGFREYVKKFNYHIFLDKVNIGSDEISINSSAKVIKIVPETYGSGGIFKIVVGALLTIFTPFKSVGISLMLSGAAEMLFAPPKNKTASQESVENSPSYIFNGAINTVAQGNPVPLAYGRVIVGSQVISAGLTSRDIPI